MVTRLTLPRVLHEDELRDLIRRYSKEVPGLSDLLTAGLSYDALYAAVERHLSAYLESQGAVDVASSLFLDVH